MKKNILFTASQFILILITLAFTPLTYAYEYCVENLSGEGCELKATIHTGKLIKKNALHEEGVIEKITTYGHTRGCISNPSTETAFPLSKRLVRVTFEATNSNCYIKKFTCEQTVPNDNSARVVTVKFGYAHNIGCQFNTKK